VFVWWALDDTRLPDSARRRIEKSERVVVSLATAWEMSIKIALGKWPAAENVFRDFEATLAANSLDILPITLAHIVASGQLPLVHRDPFDRMLAAQAMVEGLTIVTGDPALAALGAPVMPP
jgi:PIN domain nuclease of toxin-antitoxin system